MLQHIENHWGENDCKWATLSWASSRGSVFLLAGGTQTWSGLLFSQENVQDASVVPVHSRSSAVFLPCMLCLDLVIFMASFQVTFEASRCMRSYRVCWAVLTALHMQYVPYCFTAMLHSCSQRNSLNLSWFQAQALKYFLGVWVYSSTFSLGATTLPITPSYWRSISQ